MRVPVEERDIRDFIMPDMRRFFQDSTISASEDAFANISLGTPPVPGPRQYKVSVTTPKILGNIRFALGPGSGTIEIGSAGPIRLDIRTWRRVKLTIGKGTTFNGARIVCDDADVFIGEDGLWSDEILVQSNDQHGIIDLETMRPLNNRRRRIVIGDHVWIGRRATIMPDVRIGDGSILGTGSLLTVDMPERVIFGGCPAKLIRSNVSWSRSPAGFNEAERNLLGSAES